MKWLLALLCASALVACGKGDHKPKEIEVSDGIDGQDGKPGQAGEDGEPGARGPAGPAGPRGPAGPPGSGGSGRDGEDGQPCQYVETDYGYDLVCPGQEPVPIYHGSDGRDGHDGDDGRPGSPGSGMDPDYRYHCEGGWSGNGWHWDLDFWVTHYTTGQHWFQLQAIGSTRERESLFWGSRVEIYTDRFAAIFIDGNRVRFRHLSSGTTWINDCEEIPQ